MFRGFQGFPGFEVRRTRLGVVILFVVELPFIVNVPVLVDVTVRSPKLPPVAVASPESANLFSEATDNVPTVVVVAVNVPKLAPRC